MRSPVAQYPANRHNTWKGRLRRRRDERPRPGPPARPQLCHVHRDHQLHTHGHRPLHRAPNVHSPRKGHPRRRPSFPSPPKNFFNKHPLTSPHPTQTFGNTLYGPAGFLIYTITISLSALGSLNSNVFAVSRLAVAASRQDYIPRVFAGDNSAGMSIEEEERWLRVTMRKRWPGWIVWCVAGFAKSTGRLRLEKGVPV
jgi:hypothetical protein